MIPNEERCRDCRWFTLWSGSYGSGAGYPACQHPKSGPRVVNLLDDISRCPAGY